MVRCKLRYQTFWRRYTEKWAKVMTFASVSDQLACDDCSDFKQSYRLAQVPWIGFMVMTTWMFNHFQSNECHSDMLYGQVHRGGLLNSMYA